MRSPRFTLCPAPRKTVCTIGALPANQAFELLVEAHIGTKATAGEQITLILAVQGAALSPAEAAVTAVVGQTSPTPSPVPTLPVLTFPPFSSTVTPPSLAGLFPVVTPSPTPSPTSKPRSHGGVAAVTPTASTLPLDPRLIGGQLAGLAVLAAAITMVVARLSLRTPQPPTGSATGSAAAPLTGPAEGQRTS